jgi:23S rRNA (adenine2503-C2)-methyltransferase
MNNGRHIEFVESLQPPLTREKKWVLIVSTLYGCPVKCPICDAGGWYNGRLTKDEILAQIDYMVDRRYPDRKVPAEKFKIQMARMGEPSFNVAVIGVLEDIHNRYQAPCLPCISTVAPHGTDTFFERLIETKKRLYHSGRFQMQFSIHSTDARKRDFLIPIKKWNFEKIAKYGYRFYEKGDRKIALNFALAENIPVEPEIIARYFDPEIFMIKLTPLNPTVSAARNRLTNRLQDERQSDILKLTEEFGRYGFDLLVSIGELEENRIGSNCGQYVRRFRESGSLSDNSFESVETGDYGSVAAR